MRAKQLQQLAERLTRELAAAMDRIAQLEAEVAALKAKLAENSSNSHRPPSSDHPESERPQKVPSGRNPGGQPGHTKHERRFLSPDKTVVLKPTCCTNCHHALHGDDAKPERHQVVEIPRVKPDVTDYWLHCLVCPFCGEATRAELPPGVPHRGFGPRLTAMIAICTGKFRMSKRMVRELLADFLGVELSLGSVSNLEQEISASLAAPDKEARAEARKAEIANLDETGWFQGAADGRARRAWLWVGVTAAVTVFKIAFSRGDDVAKELLGKDWRGLLGSDRWSGYLWVPAKLRQLCWSHLQRDFQGFIDRKDAGAEFGRRLLALIEQMFAWWRRVRAGKLSRATFRRYMVPVRREILSLLREAEACPASKTAGMAKQMLKLHPALFTFVDRAGIELTNNSAERAVRHAVMYRKTSFGTQSDAGSRFVERILTTIATLRQQKRNVLEFVTAAYQARLLRIQPPSLVIAKR
ncbi:MAG: IS66 family transposase [Deltaproteobacteria bacterium]|nr:IS66 family transposase [Deltaproteobacteria bacterium]